MTRRGLVALGLFLLIGIAATGGSRTSIMKMGGNIVLDETPFGASLYTMGGNIRIRRAGGEVVAKTMGGNIAVEALAGRLDAGSMGGNIRVRVVGSGGGRELFLHTMGGSVELIVTRDFDATFAIKIKNAEESGRSRIDSDIPLSQTVSEHSLFFHRRRQTITASKTTSTQPNRVEISTYSNKVAIRKE